MRRYVIKDFFYKRMKNNCPDIPNKPVVIIVMALGNNMLSCVWEDDTQREVHVHENMIEEAR